MIACALLVAACGGKDPKPVKQPVVEKEEAPPPPKETEADREAKRVAQAHEIVPEGSTCLPASLKESKDVRLELGAIGSDAVVCAFDTQEERLLGAVACWKIDLGSGGLTYTAGTPIPGRGMSVRIDERCARGFCLPKDAKVTGSVARMAWNLDGSKVAIVIGDDLHLFDAATKAHERTFSIRGDKGVSNSPTAVHWVGDALYIEGADEGPFSAVWAFKSDGTPVGAIEGIGSSNPVSTHGGSFSVLDKTRVAVAEKGFSTMTIYEGDSGKRSKLVRKLTKPPCKAADLEAYWMDNDVPAKCKDHMQKNFGYLVGATAVAGSKNFLVMLRGRRLGELAVMDSRTLAEKKVIKLPWCAADATAEAGE